MTKAQPAVVMELHDGLGEVLVHLDRQEFAFQSLFAGHGLFYAELGECLLA
ncbi:MAG: hypothetical protein IID44_31360 [Planctomycetes bacterium]|nr:hypothetical protein [Planctomycetota bacterium]